MVGDYIGFIYDTILLNGSGETFSYIKIVVGISFHTEVSAIIENNLHQSGENTGIGGFYGE